MNKELERETVDYADKLAFRMPYDNVDFKTSKEGCLASAEPREKYIAELESKIEEMKRDVVECFGYEYNILVAKLLNKWEIKENE